MRTVAAIARRGTWSADLRRIGTNLRDPAALDALHAALRASRAPTEAWTGLVSGLLASGPRAADAAGPRAATGLLRRVVLGDPTVDDQVLRGVLAGFMAQPSGLVHTGERAELEFDATLAVLPLTAMARRIGAAGPQLRARDSPGAVERHQQRLLRHSLESAWEIAGGRDRTPRAQLEFALRHAWHYHCHWDDGRLLIRAAFDFTTAAPAEAPCFNWLMRHWTDPTEGGRIGTFFTAALYHRDDVRLDHPEARVLDALVTAYLAIGTPAFGLSCRLLQLLGEALRFSHTRARASVVSAIDTVLTSMPEPELLQALGHLDFQVAQLVRKHLLAADRNLLRDPPDPTLEHCLAGLAHTRLPDAPGAQGPRRTRIDLLLAGLIEGGGSRAERMFCTYELLTLVKGPLRVPDGHDGGAGTDASRASPASDRSQASPASYPSHASHPSRQFHASDLTDTADSGHFPGVATLTGIKHSAARLAAGSQEADTPGEEDGGSAGSLSLARGLRDDRSDDGRKSWRSERHASRYQSRYEERPATSTASLPSLVGLSPIGDNKHTASGRPHSTAALFTRPVPSALAQASRVPSAGRSGRISLPGSTTAAPTRRQLAFESPAQSAPGQPASPGAPDSTRSRTGLSEVADSSPSASDPADDD